MLSDKTQKHQLAHKQGVLVDAAFLGDTWDYLFLEKQSRQMLASSSCLHTHVNFELKRAGRVTANQENTMTKNWKAMVQNSRLK